MSLGHGPKIVVENLAYHIDPGNKKSFTTENLEVEYLIVAGGGGGGSGHTGSSLGGGGGGAGGLLKGVTSVSGTNAIVVGAGGAGADGPATNSTSGIDTKTEYPNSAGANGSNSTAFGLTAIGGGGGATRNAHENGKDGGSGGGACGTGVSTGGTGVSGQGNDGGSKTGGEWVACGGGGYLEAGQSSSAAYISTDGGDGGFSHLVAEYFAGGGGGGGQNTAVSQTGGTGGIGGGADGGTHPSDTVATNGQTNTGGGGGGAIAWAGNNVDSNGGNGGSGVVIIRYKGPQKASGGDLIYETDRYTVHIFNSSGSFSLGTTAGDISGNETLSTLNNGVSYVQTNSGALSFDGVNDLIYNNSYQDFVYTRSQGYYTEAWFKIPSNASTSWHGLFGNGVGEGGYFMFHSAKSAFYHHVEGGSGRIKYSNGDNGRLASSWFFDDTWHCLGVRYDPSSGESMTIFVDGTPETTHDMTTFLDTVSTIGGIRYIGAGAGRYGEHEMGSFKHYDRALSDEEIAQNFNALRGRYGV